MSITGATTGHLAVLLHMHQPLYVDPRSGVAQLPWVRLHAVRGYVDLAAMLEEFGDVRINVNFVPSLLEQLVSVGNGHIDTWTQDALGDIGAMNATERTRLLERHFSINWGRAIETRPRYRELLDKRGRETSLDRLSERVGDFSDGDLRDLTVLFYLAWFGFSVRKTTAGRLLDELEHKGRDFTVEDLQALLRLGESIADGLIDRYRRLAARGQIELSCSPAFHPIVPLLIDTDHARRARSDLPMPPSFRFADDAKLQIERAINAHETTWGQRAVGMWPAEGSVSPEALQIYESLGIKWLCTDEEILWRSLRMVGRGDVPRRELYRVHRLGKVQLVFRDRELSDRIGFSYAHSDPGAAVADLLGRAEQHLAAADRAWPPVVTLALDGENPWEAYPNSGEDFLRTLFSELTNHPRIRSSTIGEVASLTATSPALPTLHSGSWIDADFHIWIGDPVKNRAWALLLDARQRLAEAERDKTLDGNRLALARDRLLAAEGSDWFWWFGEPFHSSEDATFDRLFRSHLAGGYEALGLPVPSELERPVDDKLRRPTNATEVGWSPPRGFIAPRIGDQSSFIGWLGAGKLTVSRGAAMADTPLIETVEIGFDLQTFYVRVRPPRTQKSNWLNDGQLELELVTPRHRLRLRFVGTRWELEQARSGAWLPRASGGPVAVGATIECAVPLADLGVEAGDGLHVSLRLVRDGITLARYPADSTLGLGVPGPDSYAVYWLV